jgi:hypothetical protein
LELQETRFKDAEDIKRAEVLHRNEVKNKDEARRQKMEEQRRKLDLQISEKENQLSPHDNEVVEDQSTFRLMPHRAVNTPERKQRGIEMAIIHSRIQMESNEARIRRIREEKDRDVLQDLLRTKKVRNFGHVKNTCEKLIKFADRSPNRGG